MLRASGAPDQSGTLRPNTWCAHRKPGSSHSAPGGLVTLPELGSPQRALAVVSAPDFPNPGRKRTELKAAGSPEFYRALMARELTTLTTGGRFFEGPRWRDGTWWVSDFYRHSVYRVAPDGRQTQVLEVDTLSLIHI